MEDFFGSKKNSKHQDELLDRPTDGLRGAGSESQLRGMETPLSKERIHELIQHGYTYQEQGELKKATAIYNSILEEDSNNVDALFLLGQLHGQLGNYLIAIPLLQKATKIKPDFPDPYIALGNIFRLRKKRDEALYFYRQAISVSPNTAPAHNNLGLTLLESNKPDAAEKHIRKAIELEPRYSEAHSNLGAVLEQKEDVNGAKSHLARAIELDPDNAVAVKALTRILRKQESFEEATSFLKSLIDRFPKHVAALSSLGFVYHAMGEFHLAEDALKKGLSLAPLDVELIDNLGVTLQDQGRVDEAVALFERALQLKPNSPVVKWHLSLAHLLKGEYTPGWEEYEERLYPGQPNYREPPARRWHGQPIPENSLLVYAEQGLGDEIMFSSCIQEARRLCKKCTIECSPKLAGLFQRSFPDCTIVGHTQSSDLNKRFPEVDFAIPIGSLPLYFRPNADAFPKHRGYLKADEQLIHEWKNKLSELPPGLNVGISWIGGTTISRRRFRSIDLPEWLPILQTPNVNFISLQYTPCEDDLASLRTAQGISIHHWQHAIDDYEQTAALVQALDLVISVQTAIVHLAGALGKPTWAMVPTCSEWRYGAYGSTMPWYPSVTIHRQKSLFAWQDVIHEVANNLRTLCLQRA